MISQRLKQAILRELDLEDFILKDETFAWEVPGWDSLKHLNIILAVEKEYDIRFKNIEILKLKCVGDLQKLIDSKMTG